MIYEFNAVVSEEVGEAGRLFLHISSYVGVSASRPLARNCSYSCEDLLLALFSFCLDFILHDGKVGDVQMRGGVFWWLPACALTSIVFTSCDDGL